MAVLKLHLQVVLLSVLLSGCAFERTIRYQLEAPEASVILHATGYAVVASQPGEHYEDKLLLAMAASRQQAYRRLAEQLYGQKLHASSGTEQSVLTEDNVKSQVQGVIKGAELVEESLQGKLYVTRLRLDTANLLTMPVADIKPVSSRAKWWF
ncbi:LPP20 family lipoprotein [Rheinheimera aquimaris]|jgi:hypothetical protein|uniref:LPP20 family lipoprotein n=1 Tax=Rheinheimera aquimaris TaxID=412437 RepID=UPI000E8ED2D1|nr:LPP20 family lipoprotein [Rheinheimera aquimaris]HBN90470.1 flagellar biosynthesis protein FlgP [Rheinheimera sp.]|tara:strand:+ start:4782 stop:5240 length:459 start_codon:yes stop_codon:yes gene_type:complete